MKNGTTTRMIDRCVQEFFENKMTFIYDGRGTDTMKLQTDDAHTIFVERIAREHPGTQHYSLYGDFDGITCYQVKLITLNK